MKLTSKPEAEIGKLREALKSRTLELEEKNRELEIETALEKVRVIALGMHKPDDMPDVCKAISLQLQSLGIKNIRNVQTAIFYQDRGTYMNYEYYARHRKSFITEVDYTNHKLAKAFATKMLKGKGEVSVTHIRGQKVKDWIAYQEGTNVFIDKYLQTTDSLHYYWHSLGPVALGISTYRQLTKEELGLFNRFLLVFELAYTRYLDIEKAMAQAREAEIQLALEKVRARSLAMHHTSELQEVMNIVAQQLLSMNIDMNGGVFMTINAEVEKDLPMWGAAGAANYAEKAIVPYFDNPIFVSIVKAIRSGPQLLEFDCSDQHKTAFFKHLFRFPPWKNTSMQWKKELLSRKGGYTRSLFVSRFTSIGMTNHHGRRFTEAENEILRRFGNVLEQSFTRFLDLQKAEAQAREAEIELALERVRARAMAMQKSEELREAAAVLYKELSSLHIGNLVNCGYVFIDEKNKLQHAWMTRSDGSIREAHTMPLLGDSIMNERYEKWKRGIKLFSQQVGGKKLKTHESFANRLSKQQPAKNNSGRPDLPDPAFFYCGNFSDGYLHVITGEALSQESTLVLTRFTNVFEQTYTRFLDLQKAEAQAREAIKRASVDRIRAEIASMRTTNDLERIQPLIWNELKTLGVPFIRCGVFIMDEGMQQVQTFLSTPDGKAIAAFRLPYYSTEQITQIITHWQQKQIFRDYMDEAAFAAYTHNLVLQGAVSSDEKYVTENRPTELYLHFLPFLQGMLYVGNVTSLGEDELQLVQNLADAFSTAYARYEDFNKLEAAKKQVENTLNELQVTQKQLIQSEKMASLGELTAGIAHEIQNPLNFVNNFSEVNAELIDELNELLAAGNMQEAKEIGANIKENEEKITFHSKRADAIVKGMLLHSRSSKGAKEPTAINALCEEYVRLAYHGLRAKDHSFTAVMKTDFDETIGNVNIVPQDIGRVVLNLINNAFYAVAEKKSKSGVDYEPVVSVRTKKLNGKVEIVVQDNGNGIPQKVLDKIFQPFFTTKPTGEGTGLGLSLSYDIVKAHGGELVVETHEGSGTEFTIQLPGNIVL